MSTAAFFTVTAPLSADTIRSPLVPLWAFALVATAVPKVVFWSALSAKETACSCHATVLVPVAEIVQNG